MKTCEKISKDFLANVVKFRIIGRGSGSELHDFLPLAGRQPRDACKIWSYAQRKNAPTSSS